MNHLHVLLIKTEILILVLHRRSRLLFFLEKYIIGIIPPSNSPHTVAAAAPASPNPKAPTNSASRMIFVTPDATITLSPSLGFSAATKNSGIHSGA